jgi:hypothetical protein
MMLENKTMPRITDLNSLDPFSLQRKAMPLISPVTTFAWPYCAPNVHSLLIT